MIRFGTFAHLSAIVVCLRLIGCAESSVLPPAMPTPLPADKIERLAITCPADRRARSLDGAPTVVHFQAPLVIGGQQPVAAGCSPHSGSAFRIGSTEVTCGADDGLRQTASCAFSVTILPPPKLAVTRILAFGDSITAGTPASSYPLFLERILALQYVAQDIRVINAGKGGEHVRHAFGRFSAELGRHRPEVLLLMEGTNDLFGLHEAGPAPAAAMLDRMVATAVSADIDTYLMTVAPWRSAVHAPLVSDLNDRIRSIAARRGVPLVDVHHILLTGPCNGPQSIPCIGPDGVHPTEHGLRLIAEDLARILVARYDVTVPQIAGSRSGRRPASDGKDPGPSLNGGPAFAGPVHTQGRSGRGAATATVGQ